MTAEQWSAVISGIALIVAISSPIINSIINNKFQLKLNKQRFLVEHRAEVIEKFVHSVGELCGDIEREQFLREYSKNSSEIYLYIPENLWEKVDKINSLIFENNYSEARKTLLEFCKCLNKHHPRFIEN
jgi:hypothetical protein